ncbi:hypothetical protein CHUAL_014238 [Chamberlinius hualienensis]
MTKCCRLDSELDWRRSGSQLMMIGCGGNVNGGVWLPEVIINNDDDRDELVTKRKRKIVIRGESLPPLDHYALSSNGSGIISRSSDVSFELKGGNDVDSRHFSRGCQTESSTNDNSNTSSNTTQTTNVVVLNSQPTGSESITTDPLKCPKCRRIYKTEASVERHLETCNFVLSSSSDDEEEEDEIRTIVQPTSDVTNDVVLPSTSKSSSKHSKKNVRIGCGGGGQRASRKLRHILSAPPITNTNSNINNSNREFSSIFQIPSFVLQPFNVASFTLINNSNQIPFQFNLIPQQQQLCSFYPNNLNLALPTLEQSFTNGQFIYSNQFNVPNNLNFSPALCCEAATATNLSLPLPPPTHLQPEVGTDSLSIHSSVNLDLDESRTDLLLLPTQKIDDLSESLVNESSSCDLSQDLSEFGRFKGHDESVEKKELNGSTSESLVNQSAVDTSLPHLAFEITSDDGFRIQSKSIDDAWKQVAEIVQNGRSCISSSRRLPIEGIDGLRMIGLTRSAVQRCIEQLPGARHCKRLLSTDGQSPGQQLLFNKSGCARSEPYRKQTLNRRRMFRRQTIPGQTTDEDIPAKILTSRRSSNGGSFRTINYKESVEVFRSNIHGLGIYSKRGFEAGEQVMEYAGEVIRPVLADQREKFYQSKGVDCYMFRIDEREVIDATIQGNLARFINHSCEPNCYSKLLTVENKKHIAIFALRRIVAGEELTYDYKFPIEEVKLPCTCGSRKCRRFLN